MTAVIEQLTLVSPPTLLSGPGDRVLWSMARLRVQRQRAERERIVGRAGVCGSEWRVGVRGVRDCEVSR